MCKTGLWCYENSSVILGRINEWKTDSFFPSREKACTQVHWFSWGPCLKTTVSVRFGNKKRVTSNSVDLSRVKSRETILTAWTNDVTQQNSPFSKTLCDRNLWRLCETCDVIIIYFHNRLVEVLQMLMVFSDTFSKQPVLYLQRLRRNLINLKQIYFI